MMGAFQGAFAKIMGGIAAGKLLEEKRQKAMQNVEDVKMAKLKQKDEYYQRRASIAKNKKIIATSDLARIEAKQKTAELKGKNERVTLGGKVITDPVLLSKIKEAQK